jgi:hypothetical protein
VVTVASVSLWAAAPLWAIAGAGMGLGYPTVSILTIQQSAADEQGANSAALQVCDVIGSITGIASAATVVAVAGREHFAGAMRIVDAALAVVAVAGLALTQRAVPASGSAVRR